MLHNSAGVTWTNTSIKTESVDFTPAAKLTLGVRRSSQESPEMTHRALLTEGTAYRLPLQPLPSKQPDMKNTRWPLKGWHPTCCKASHKLCQGCHHCLCAHLHSYRSEWSDWQKHKQREMTMKKSALMWWFAVSVYRWDGLYPDLLLFQ